MTKFTVTIHVEQQAPSKPGLGAPCNGCGVCCLMEPCPLGVLLTGRRSGACSALRWQPVSHQYRCGAITNTQEVLRVRLPRFTHGAIPPLATLLARLAQRWVAVGVGCDCDVAVPALAPDAPVLPL